MNWARCARCGGSPVDWHHLTGRCSPGGAYLDRDLVVPLCRRCHAREHAVLRGAEAEWPDGRDLLCHRLVRLTLYVGQIADRGYAFVIVPGSVPALHSLLCDVTTQMRRNP